MIVNDVNRYLENSPKNVRILHDDAHSTWVCLEYCPKNKPYRINFFTPGNYGWNDFPNAKEKFANKINAWLPELQDPNPFKNLVIVEKCRKSKNPAEQFLYVLMFAFGCALNNEESFLNPFGNKSIEDVRKIVCSEWSNGFKKEMPTIQAIWNGSS